MQIKRPRILVTFAPKAFGSRIGEFRKSTTFSAGKDPPVNGLLKLQNVYFWHLEDNRGTAAICPLSERSGHVRSVPLISYAARSRYVEKYPSAEPQREAHERTTHAAEHPSAAPEPG